MHEEWKDIPGYEGLYSASNLGRIKSKHAIKKQTLSKYTKHQKRFRVTLTKDGKSKQFLSHTLVATTFLGIPHEGMYVCHKDGDATNNNITNLYYGTRHQNMADSIKHDTFSMGERHPCCKLSTKDAIDIVLSGEHYQKVALRYDIHPFTVHKIRRGKVREIETRDARKNAPPTPQVSHLNKFTEDELKTLKDTSISQRKAALTLGLSQRAVFNWRKKLGA